MGYLLPHLVTESTDRDPCALALQDGRSGLDYAALERRTNQVARALREVGVRPGDRVGLHLKKSVEAVVALVGIMKSGACAVPITAGMPAPRVRQIVDQCEMRVMVSARAAAPTLEHDALAGSALERILSVDGSESGAPAATRWVDLAEAAAEQSSEPLPIPTTDRDLAYVLFTSGSTGRPKGVMISHRAVLTFVNWATDEFHIQAEDRLSNHASLSFDLSTFDIFGALRAGASVTVIAEGLSSFPTKLAELVEQQRITVWYSVPSVLTMMLSRGGLDDRDLSALRLVLFAGEVFPVTHLRELMLAIPRPRYVNLYGPTETNVCTFYEVPGAPEPDARPIPIGRACANTKTVLLDEHGHPIDGEGAEGLLHVGGSTLMDGYYGLPAETEAAFRTNPQAHGRVERLYCTGDWVKHDDQGEYIFLGRRDHMVKIGGHRVELGEIEAALHSCPGVAEAVAVAVPDEMIGSRVRAVVVPAKADLDEQAVTRHCASLLPRYMVPHEVELRASLPRTATDKVDRPALLREGEPS